MRNLKYNKCIIILFKYIMCYVPSLSSANERITNKYYDHKKLQINQEINNYL